MQPTDGAHSHDRHETRSNVYARFGERMTRLLLAHRLVALALGLAIFGVLAIGGRWLAFSTDYRIFFSHEDTGLAAFEKLETTFHKTDNVLFVVKSREGSVFQGDALAAVRDLTARANAIPYVARIDSITNFPRAFSRDGDLVVAPILGDGPIDDASRADAEHLATTEPILVGSLLSHDSKTTAVNVSLDLPRKDSTEVSRSMESAEALAGQLRAEHPDLDVRVSGMAAVNHAFMETAVRDLGVMLPIMLIVMLGTMAFLLRSALATFAVGVVIVIAGGASMTVAGWFGYPLTPPSIAAPMMVLTVVIADGVHVVLGVLGEMSNGRSRHEAIVSAIRSNLEALTYTWLTTVVGFVCLNASDAPPVRHLANMTTVGVTVAFVYSVTFLPVLLSFLPLTPRPSIASSGSPRLGALATWIARRRMAVLVTVAAVTIASGFAASKLRTNDQFVQYFARSTAFRQDAEFTMKNLSGIYRVEFQLPSVGPDGITDPAYLGKVDDFATYLRTQPEVDHVFSFADVMKRLVSATHDDQTSDYRVPATRGEASELVLLYEMGLPPGQDLTDRVSLDKSATRLSVVLKDLSSRDMTDFANRAENWLQTNAPTMKARATGPVVIFSALSDRNARGMLRADFLSLGLISLCMVLVLGSFRLGILSVVPNLVPIIVGYGIWYLAVGQMNVVATVAGSISLGVIVDDTIHFLTHFRQEREDPAISLEAALESTMRHAGPAMLSTSFILVLGFGVLTLSSFQMTSYLGWLSVLIVAIAPFADLVLVPALVLTFDAKHARKNVPWVERAHLRLDPDSDPSLASSALSSVSKLTTFSGASS